MDPNIGTRTVTVYQADTTTTVTASPDPSIAGAPVAVLAKVTVNAPGSGTPTGTVTFTGPDGLRQTVTLDGMGQAGMVIPSRASGTITATYNGDAKANSSAGTTPVTVNKADTTTTVTASPDPSVAGEPVTVLATVTVNAPATGTPTGTVTFSGGGGLNQTVPLDGMGRAGMVIPSLASGTITANYNGDAKANSSAGATPVTVNAAVTSVTLASSRNPSDFGEDVTFSAVVTSDFSTPGGTVDFLDGAIVIGSANLTGGTASFTTHDLARGNHEITASYRGTTSFKAGVSPPLTQSVGTPNDSLALRAMQVQATRTAALTSGQALTSALESGIAAGLDGTASSLVMRPGVIQLSYVPENTAPSIPWPGSDSAERFNSWHIWGDLRTNGTGKWGNGDQQNLSGLQLNALMGLSYKVTPDLLLGVVGGFEAFEYTSNRLNARLDGKGWTIGGYAGGKSGNLRYFGAAAYSGITYQGKSGAAGGAFDASRWIVTGGLAGDFQAYGLAVEPSLNVFGLWEQQDAYTDSLGTGQQGRGFQAGRVSAGVKVVQPMDGKDMTLLPYAGLYADLTTEANDAGVVTLGLAGDALSFTKGVSGRAVAGVNATLGGGAQVNLGGEFGGIGADLQSWSVRAGMHMPF